MSRLSMFQSSLSRHAHYRLPMMMPMPTPELALKKAGMSMQRIELVTGEETRAKEATLELIIAENAEHVLKCNSVGIKVPEIASEQKCRAKWDIFGGLPGNAKQAQNRINISYIKVKDWIEASEPNSTSIVMVTTELGDKSGPLLVQSVVGVDAVTTYAEKSMVVHPFHHWANTAKTKHVGGGISDISKLTTTRQHAEGHVRVDHELVVVIQPYNSAWQLGRM
ncbi:uncharacterized protein PHACADRAFT_25124 [Phanerochaete carnosa HHB-10118-sp]|uniref:Uncharacterized protein n=1 Tax=Phanerochaete carnosa (strain HHB-10118-sp) TaxID=650164 RepID=K5X7Z8_PHACS|nr:uncharacterized protein PHACADRAFT_25124 [Phanerochaete carnosa HHB-10118-sp]EKM58992.1 hypothetical protein PHACADRAFT_25124 [Phanerochaete carnosa HHB-10118-sp]